MVYRAPEDPEDLDGDLRQLPLDPDVTAAEDAAHGPDAPPAGAFGARQRSGWPRIHWRSVVAVGVGGFFGGLARYGVGLLWSTPAGTFPYATFAVNACGAFLLALLLVLVLDVLPPTTYLRPALGTGFCGAYTTFSSVVVSSNQLVADGSSSLAAGYLAASVFTGLAATSFGILLGRAIAANRVRRAES